jgi:hypothetical protein
MRALVICGVAFALSACAQPPQPAPSTTSGDRPPLPVMSPGAEIKSDAEQWVDCLSAKAGELDDHRSDAATIAVAAKGACHQYYHGNESGEIETATQVVLQRRAPKAPPGQAAAGKTRSRMEAEAKVWSECAGNAAREIDDGIAAVGGVVDGVVATCHALYTGNSWEERNFATQIVSDLPARIVVSPPQPLPPVDLRF